MCASGEKHADSAIALIQSAEERLQRVKEDHPQWYADFEDTDPFFADRSDCQRLLATAPTDFAEGYMTGIMVMRKQLADMTGREF